VVCGIIMWCLMRVQGLEVEAWPGSWESLWSKKVKKKVPEWLPDTVPSPNVKVTSSHPTTTTSCATRLVADGGVVIDRNVFQRLVPLVRRGWSMSCRVLSLRRACWANDTTASLLVLDSRLLTLEIFLFG